MIIKTGRFGQLNIAEEEIISIPQGILGFPEYTSFCLVDPGDETLILWLQSIDNPEVCFPVLEPKIFKGDYKVKLSPTELREMRARDSSNLAVFSVLTIPDNVTEMTANLKAPLVINRDNRVGRQVILQDNEYGIKHMMFKELRTHLITIQSQQKNAAPSKGVSPVPVRDFPIADNVTGAVLI